MKLASNNMPSTVNGDALGQWNWYICWGLQTTRVSLSSHCSGDALRGSGPVSETHRKDSRSKNSIVRGHLLSEIVFCLWAPRPSEA